VIPLETDPTDFKRVRSMLTELFEMRRRNESSAMVKQVWCANRRGAQLDSYSRCWLLHPVAPFLAPD
jgi:hypothetical protein